MEKCPRCHALRPRYKLKTRRVFTYIAVACEGCGYTGEEVPMSHPDDSAAATQAAAKWNAAAKAAASLPIDPRVLH